MATIAWREIFRNLSFYDKIVVGVSGGSDSMFLLLSLIRNSKVKNKIVVAHVNHNNGLYSERSQNLVAMICKKNGIDFRVKILNENHEKTEMAWRKSRYEFFGEIAKEFSSVIVLTAHHKNDNIETMIMEFMRGHMPRGIPKMRNFKEGNCAIYRPFLDYPKKMLTKLAIVFGVGWIDDPSNVDSSNERSIIREELLPVMNKIRNVEKTIPKILEGGSYE